MTIVNFMPFRYCLKYLHLHTRLKILFILGDNSFLHYSRLLYAVGRPFPTDLDLEQLQWCHYMHLRLKQVGFYNLDFVVMTLSLIIIDYWQGIERFSFRHPKCKACYCNSSVNGLAILLKFGMILLQLPAKPTKPLSSQVVFGMG